MCQAWCSGIQGMSAQLGRVNQPWVYTHRSIYIYRSAKFGVAVFKASKLQCPGSASAMGRCVLFYIYIDRYAKFGVTVFKASMLD